MCLDAMPCPLIGYHVITTNRTRGRARSGPGLSAWRNASHRRRVSGTINHNFVLSVPIPRVPYARTMVREAIFVSRATVVVAQYSQCRVHISDDAAKVRNTKKCGSPRRAVALAGYNPRGRSVVDDNRMSTRVGYATAGSACPVNVREVKIFPSLGPYTLAHSQSCR